MRRIYIYPPEIEDLDKETRAEQNRKYMKFMSSDKWDMIRQSTFSLKGKECEKCHSTKNLQIHHISYNDELEWVKEKDLMVLCRKCHNVMHQDLECFARERE